MKHSEPKVTIDLAEYNELIARPEQSSIELERNLYVANAFLYALSLHNFSVLEALRYMEIEMGIMVKLSSSALIRSETSRQDSIQSIVRYQILNNADLPERLKL